jgi:hypothetical protein
MVAMVINVVVKSLVGSPLVKELKRNKRKDGIITAQAFLKYVVKKGKTIIT